MPVYKYKCTECGYEEEIICKYEERPEVLCCRKHWRKTPQDDKMTMVLVPSFANFVVNGFNEKNGYSGG